MFMRDRWEELRDGGNYDRRTVEVARELADEMCREIFDKMGYSVVVDDVAVRVSGRGLTFIFPLRGSAVPMKYMDPVGFSRGRRESSATDEDDL